MTNSIKLFCLGILYSVLVQAHPKDLGSYKCMGGDGPNPLTDVTQLQKVGTTVFDSKGVVQEFFLWERKGKIVYRNQFGNIYLLDLKTGKSVPFGSSSIPLSRVKDEDERFITLSGTPITLVGM
ncbi:hypothetical protein EBT16_14510, partial [bacterium]|nr:hypothetical protein [bacterium]